MMYKEIEAIFTQKVADLIQKGYVFNSTTMSGHQGEIAKVDLRKGEEVIRVQMFNEYRSNADWISVSVSRVNRKVSTSRHETIWNSDLEVIEEMKFFKVSDNFFVETEEEIKAINKKQYIRFRNRYVSNLATLDDAAKQIVLPYVNRQKGFKSCKAKDIDKVVKCTTKHGALYRIEVKGKSIILR